MKKKRSNGLKKLAEILPPAYIKRAHTERVKLYLLYQRKENGEKTGELPKLTSENRDQIFLYKYFDIEILNHHKRLKKAWNKDKTKGIQDYLKWLKRHNERWAKINDDVQQLDPMLYKIAKMPVGKFWQSLFIFLYSFFTSFSKKDDT